MHSSYYSYRPMNGYTVLKYFIGPHQINDKIMFMRIDFKACRIGPAAPVLAGPVFSQGKSKIPFLQKTSNKQSTSVILGLIRLITLSYNG